jgi:hypothetical protein
VRARALVGHADEAAGSSSNKLLLDVMAISPEYQFSTQKILDLLRATKAAF